MKLKIECSIYCSGSCKTEISEVEMARDMSEEELYIINIYPEIEYQEFLGFGGAFTESAGYTLSRMSDDVYSAVIDEYFGKNGLNYTFCRTHIDSCDFSLDNYSAVIDAEDYDLKTFSLSRDEKYIIPMIKRANMVSRQPIKILLSPWSPPAFMKTNGQKNYGGKLMPEYREMWARYISKYISEYKKREIDVAAISVQNEPKAIQTWDSCIYSAEEEGEFVSEFLAQRLAADGLSDVKIIIWDHNKERAYERARDTLMVGCCGELVSGIGFHWYSGDHFEALDLIRKLYPEKLLIFSEGCVEYRTCSQADQLGNAQRYAHDIIGNLNAGMNAFIDWNLVLDENGGPNHAGNYCDSPVMCDTSRNTYEKKLSYTYIGHFSRYILPGALRIGYTKYTDKLEVTAFKNTDGTIVIIILNRLQETIPYNLRVYGQICNLKAEPASINTLHFIDLL